MTRRAIAAALILAAVLAGWTKTGMAHAMLVASEPADGAALAVAPGEIVLRFNEPVMPVALRVLDAAGSTLAVAPPPPLSDSVVRATLPAALPAGAYLASWRVVSADSHPVGGSFAFTIGPSAGAPAGDDQLRRENAWHAAVIANRAVGDAALLLAAGGALALVLVFGAAAPRGSRALLVAASMIAMASALLSIPLARGWIAAPIEALLDPSAWMLGEGAPHRGRTAMIVCGLALVLSARRDRTAGRLLAAAGALIACAGVPLSGHVAALAPSWPAQLALFVHTAGAAFWIGALPMLALAVRQASPAEAHRLLRRFSACAIAIVTLLILAGIGVALTRVHDVAALTDSAYGRLLLAKAALVALMLALAIANRCLTRSLPRANGGTAARLNNNIVLEIGAAAAILALTSWLGHTRPPDETTHAHAASSGRAFMAIESDGAMLLAEIDPGRRGANRLTGTMSAPDGQPVRARELAVELSLPSAGIEPILAPAVRGAAGRFTVDAIALPVRGRWTLRVDALVGDFEKRVFTLQLEIE